MEITINSRQALLIIWSVIAIIISLIVTLSLPFMISYYYYIPWQLLIGIFFGLLLALVLPFYLFLALWTWLSDRAVRVIKEDEEER